MNRPPPALLALALFLGAGPESWGGAGPPQSCGPFASRARRESGPARPRPELGPDGLWPALGKAERDASDPALSEQRRVQAYSDVGEIRSLIGDSVGAERAFRRVLDLAPGDAEASYRLARLLRDRPEEALPRAEAAACGARSARRRAAAHILAGEIRLDLGDSAGARAGLKRALALEPGNLEALEVLVRAARDRPPEAAVHAGAALKAADSAPPWHRGAAYRLCGRIWVEAGDFSRAVESLRRALSLDPMDIEALEALVQIKRERPQALRAAPPSGRGKLPAAGEKIWNEAAAGRALARDPGDLEALRGLIALRHGQKRPGEARALAARLTDAAWEAPAWQQAAALRLASGIWNELGDPPRAFEAERRAVDLDRRAPLRIAPDAAPEYEMSALINEVYIPIASARIALEDYEEAEALLRRALESSPGEAKVLSLLADLALAQGRPVETEKYSELLGAAAAGTPEGSRSDALARKARVELRLGDEAGAEATLRRALESAPGHREARSMLARLKLDQGRPKEALVHAERLVKDSEWELPARRADALAGKARALLELKDQAGAETSLRRALELAPGHREALSLLVELKLEQGRPEQALEYAERLVAASEGEPPARRADALAGKARVEFELKDRAGAETSLKRALERLPDHLGALSLLARITLEGGRPEQALGYAERLVAASEGEPPARRADALEQKARALLELKDQAGAEKSLKRALELDPGHSGSLSLRKTISGAKNREP